MSRIDGCRCTYAAFLGPLVDIPLFWLQARIAEEIRDFHTLLWIDLNKCGREGVFPRDPTPPIAIATSTRHEKYAAQTPCRRGSLFTQPAVASLITMHTTSDRTDWRICTCKIQALVSPMTIEWVCIVPTDARNRQSAWPGYTTRATMTETLMRRQKSGRPPPSFRPPRIAESKSCEVHKH